MDCNIVQSGFNEFDYCLRRIDHYYLIEMLDDDYLDEMLDDQCWIQMLDDCQDLNEMFGD